MIIQPRPFNLRKTLTVLAVLGVATYFYYQRPPPLQLWRMSGFTMGTTYSIKLLDNRLTQAHVQQLKAEIDTLLEEVNRQMSTYLPGSEISAFNRSDGLEAFPVSEGFASVTRLALALCRDTGGAFSPALDQLINAWGFGPQGPRLSPDAKEVEAMLAWTGCDAIEVTGDGALTKKHPEATLNLNAIAKGWGVDEVARLIETKGVTNLFVEIGGEVFARGISEKIRRWRVGIDRPVEGAMTGEGISLIVELDGKALATSGNYRNFHMTGDGGKVVHILDPRTGMPSRSTLASVSVIAENAVLADGLATALYVMGTTDGLAWVNGNADVEAVFIEHGPDGDFTLHRSAGFARYEVD